MERPLHCSKTDLKRQSETQTMIVRPNANIERLSPLKTFTDHRRLQKTNEDHQWLAVHIRFIPSNSFPEVMPDILSMSETNGNFLRGDDVI